MPVFACLPGWSGVLEVEISQLHIRRSALIKADPGIVWEEFTTFERISAWLDQGHKLLAFEPRLGGKVRFSVVIEGAERFFGGTVIELLPGREITFDDGWEDRDFAYYARVTNYWTFRLTAVGDSTLVELFHHQYEAFGERVHDALDSYEMAWDNKHLRKLREIVERRLGKPDLNQHEK